MGWDPAEDAWLAGFADGEGCFWVLRYRGARGTTYTPGFTVALRADDEPVLRALQARFGGSVSRKPGGRGGAPAVQWAVKARADVPALADYFERFPLRAKKARTAALWISAVRAHQAGGSQAPELAFLWAQLRAARTYREAA